MMSIFCSVKSGIWISFKEKQMITITYHIGIIWYKNRIDMSKTVKIIHVHFISGHRNYYFGSVRAIYKMFSPEELGCSEIYLRHQLTQTGNHFLNDRVLIIRSTLIRQKKNASFFHPENGRMKPPVCSLSQNILTTRERYPI